jgi:hypothetical protein
MYRESKPEKNILIFIIAPTFILFRRDEHHTFQQKIMTFLS